MNTKSSVILLSVVFGFMPFFPEAHGVSPAPGGCYPNFTTAEGCNALSLLTTGAGNTGVGWYSLFVDATGNFNTGVGAGALVLNNADSNTAVGAAALLLNTSGTENVAVGTDALVYNDAGNYNNAVNEFLKEHCKVEEQQAAITELEAVIAQQQKEFQAVIAEERRQFEARLKQQDARIEMVSAQFEFNHPATRTVSNNH